MKSTIKICCTFLLLFFMFLVFSGCSSYETYSSDSSVSSEEINADAPVNDAPFFLQNGHVTDTGIDRIVTPCCLAYERIGLILETEISDDISNYYIEEDELSDDKQYLVIHARFITALQSQIDYHNQFFSVYADGEPCEILVDEPLLLLPQEITEIHSYYHIPKNYIELTIEYDIPLSDKRIVFLVQDDGKFNEEDIENIINNNPVSHMDHISECVVPISSVVSDSFYHSNSTGIDYTAELTCDGNYNSCWQDGSEGDAIGETINYYFSECPITDIKIVNGNRRDNASYLSNNRLERITLGFYLSDSQVAETEICFTDDESIVETLANLDSSIRCDLVSLTIQSVYNGTQYSDTCISEVSLLTFHGNFSDLELALFFRLMTLYPLPTPTPTSTPRPTSTSTPTPLPTNTPVPQYSSGPSVIITATGDHYHSHVHGNMRNYWYVSLSEAQSMGLTPCGTCY